MVTLEAMADLVRGERSPEKLDRDEAIELHVSGSDDDTRPSFADEPLEAVLLGEDVTDVERDSAERAHAVDSECISLRNRKVLGLG